MDLEIKKTFVRRMQFSVFGGFASFFFMSFIFKFIGLPTKASLFVAFSLFLYGGVMLALSKGRSPLWGILGITLVGIGIVNMLTDKPVLEEWSREDAKVNKRARFFGIFMMLSQFPLFIIASFIFSKDEKASGFSIFMNTGGVIFGWFFLMLGLFMFLLRCPWCKKKIKGMKKSQSGNFQVCEHCNKNWRY